MSTDPGFSSPDFSNSGFFDPDFSNPDFFDPDFSNPDFFEPDHDDLIPDPIRDEDDAVELIRDVVDLDDIVRGSLLLFLCDPDRRPAMPVIVTDIPVTTPAGDVLDHWFDHLGRAFEVETPSLIFARARPGQSFILDHDRQWHDAVARGCADAGIPLLHSFLLTQHAVVPFPPPVPRWQVSPPDGRAQAG